jgi:hypothetical protein
MMIAKIFVNKNEVKFIYNKIKQGIFTQLIELIQKKT